MSGRNSRRARDPKSQPPPSPPSTVSRARPPRWLLGGVAVVMVAAAAAAALQWWRARPLPPFPAATAAAPELSRFDEYAGAAACAECHVAQHEAWQGSTHGRAGGTPAERRPIRSFDGRPIEFADGIVIPETGAAGALRFIVRARGRDPVTYRVDAIVGAAAMVGGGTQAYLTRHIDGTVRLLPWELTADGTWFCNTGTRVERGWQPITRAMRLADCGDWPPRRVLGHNEKLANCQECHGSQIESVATQSLGRQTQWQSLAINCESCHGPARQHVAAARAGQPSALPSLTILNKEESVRLCLRCHALKDALRPEYRAGMDIDAHYSVGLAAMAEEGLLPDGRTRSFAYQEGHLASACFLNGGMTCVDCHAPHDQTYRTFQGEPLPGRFDDRQCTSCHASKAVDVTAHTRHLPGSPGSRCVSCHMPYLQQPDVGNGIRYARSDHTISIPRPELDSAFGVRGACASCHRDRSNAQLASTIQQWHGAVKPLPRAVAALVEGAPVGALADALEDSTAPPLATLALLGREFRRLALQEGTLDRRTRAALERVVMARDIDLAAGALALLHFAHGNERRTRRILIDALRTRADAALLRPRWSAVLGWIGDILNESGRTHATTRAYEQALAISPEHAGLLRSLGYAHLRLGDARSAARAFREAARHRPNDALAHIGLGIALANTGDELAAADAYRAAVRADRFEPLAHFNLANVALRAGRYAEAVTGYQRALEIDPAMPAAHFNLARARLALGQYAQAATSIRMGLELEPGNQAAADMLTQLQAAGHGIEGGQF